MQREARSESAAQTASTWLLTSPHRDPPFFAGLRGDDVDDWLDEFNRISQFNRWDDVFKLQIVPFSLNEVAKTWFYNNKGRFADWTTFTDEIRQAFGTPSLRSDCARKKLNSRVQHPEETDISYIEDVLVLCRRVDESMLEANKVRHILKGIAPFPFNALALQNPTSVNDVRTTCLRLDQLQPLRLQLEPSSTCMDGDMDLRTLIRSIIREELQNRTSPCPPRDNCRPNASYLRDLIKEELASMTAVPSVNPAPSTIHAMSYCDAASEPPMRVEAPPLPLSHGHLTAISAGPYPQPYYSHVRPDRQLFPRDRPVCYYCGIRGHISRFCQRRQQDERRGYAHDERDDTRFVYGARRNGYVSPPRRPSPPRDSTDISYNRPARRRSPSPYRRSLSPFRPASRPTDQASEN